MSATTRKKGAKNKRINPTPAQLKAKHRRRTRLAISLGVLLFTAGFSALSIVAYAWMTQTPMFSARFVLVSGNKKLSTREVLSAADIQSGDNIFGVSLDLAKARLTAHPWVDTASVMREFPNRLIIRVTEHKAAAIVRMGNPYLVNPRGELFARVEEPKPKATDKVETNGDPKPDGLPLIEGVPQGSLPVAGVPQHHPKGRTAESVKEILPLLGELAANQARFKVQSLEIHPELGLDLITTGATRKIRLGYGNYREKLKRVRRMFAFLETRVKKETQEKLNAVESVDVRDIHSVVIKPATS